MSYFKYDNFNYDEGIYRYQRRVEGDRRKEGLTLDAELRKLLRLERQRQMGLDVAERGATEDDRAWITGSNAAVARAIG